jgi:hypothetical protein
MPQLAEKIRAWSSDSSGHEFPRENVSIDFSRNAPPEIPHDYVHDIPRRPRPTQTTLRPSPFINELFESYVREWTSKSRHSSSIRRMIELSSYRRIIDLGRPVIPLLLRELKDRPNFWFPALRELTGETEIGKERTFDEARKEWIAWGEAHGHLHR